VHGRVEVTPPVPDDYREKEVLMARRARGGTEGVRGALSRRTGRTAAEIAEAAGIGRSTANKALAALEAEGKAYREPGGRDGARRLPDRWSLPREGRAKRSSGSTRLGRSELAAMVLNHLRANPRAEFTPSAVAKALGGKSGGAIGNALERLVASGDAVKVAESPRSYRVKLGRAARK
jgi:hypothetical protein